MAVATEVGAVVMGVAGLLEDFTAEVAAGMFYASLSDEQKAKFNTVGPPPKATSPQGRQSGGQQ